MNADAKRDSVAQSSESRNQRAELTAEEKSPGGGQGNQGPGDVRSEKSGV